MTDSISKNCEKKEILIIKKGVFQNHVLRTGYYFLSAKYLSRLFVLNLKMKF